MYIYTSQSVHNESMEFLYVTVGVLELHILPYLDLPELWGFKLKFSCLCFTHSVRPDVAVGTTELNIKSEQNRIRGTKKIKGR